MEVILSVEQMNALTATLLFQCNVIHELGLPHVTPERLRSYCECYDAAPLVQYLLTNFPLLRSFMLLGLPSHSTTYNMLVHAVITNNVDVFDLLLETPETDVNTLLASDFTPLHFAALFGRSHFFHRLLQHGAKINAKTKKGKTPLSVVLSQKNPSYDLVLLSCQFGARVTRRMVSNSSGLLHELLANTRRAQKISRDTGMDITHSVLSKYELAREDTYTL